VGASSYQRRKSLVGGGRDSYLLCLCDIAPWRVEYSLKTGRSSHDFQESSNAFGQLFGDCGSIYGRSGS
jgi:hypothetical protein